MRATGFELGFAMRVSSLRRLSEMCNGWKYQIVAKRQAMGNRLAKQEVYRPPFSTGSCGRESCLAIAVKISRTYRCVSAKGGTPP